MANGLPVNASHFIGVLSLEISLEVMLTEKLLMGSPKDEVNWVEQERLLHRVTVP